MLEGKNIGFAITGSYCTFDKILPIMRELKTIGANLYPIVSEKIAVTDTRFWKASKFIEVVNEISGRYPILTIPEAEPIGTKNYLDLVIVAPCTGNTLSKLANAITDTSVTMACKAHLRNNKPVVLAISTNDGLSANAKNIGVLLNRKNIFFVPFGQDDPLKKTNSLVADMSLAVKAMEMAMEGQQYQPILLSDKSIKL